jgi:hypothetical protein
MRYLGAERGWVPELVKEASVQGVESALAAGTVLRARETEFSVAEQINGFGSLTKNVESKRRKLTKVMLGLNHTVSSQITTKFMHKYYTLGIS